jgi:hypothetical protein
MTNSEKYSKTFFFLSREITFEVFFFRRGRVSLNGYEVMFFLLNHYELGSPTLVKQLPPLSKDL